MLKLTNLADYAVLLMCEIGQAKNLVNAQGLSATTGLPVPTVSKILNSLARADLLESKRGIGGGFCLRRNADEINVAMIVEAIDGPIAVTACAGERNADCSLDNDCMMRPRWQVINQALRYTLAGVSLSLLLETSGTEHLRSMFEVMENGRDARASQPKNTR